MTTVRPAIDAATRAAIAARAEALLRRAGALGDDGVIDPGKILEDPLATSELCGFLAAGLLDREGRTLVDVVVGSPGPAATLAFEAARQLGVGCRTRSGAGIVLDQGDRVLLVDAVRNGGSTLDAAIAAVEAASGEVVACVALVDVIDERARLTSPATGRTYPYRALWRPPATDR